MNLLVLQRFHRSPPFATSLHLKCYQAQCFASWLTNSVLPCHDEHCSHEQCSQWAELLDANRTCSMQTEPAIFAIMRLWFMFFWIINRISQLQLKMLRAQLSINEVWKKWGLLGQNLVGMSMTRQNKKVTVELHVSYMYPWIWSRHQSRLHMALLRNPLFLSRADWSKQRGTLLVKN